MKNKLEQKIEFCPFMNVCAIEYGADLVCQDENSYEDCLIYKELIKQQEKN